MSQWPDWVMRSRRGLHAAAGLVLLGVAGGWLGLVGALDGPIVWGYASTVLLAAVAAYHMIQAGTVRS